MSRAKSIKSLVGTRVAIAVLAAALASVAVAVPADADLAATPQVQLDSRDSEGHLLQVGNDNDAYWVNGDGPQNPEHRTEGPGPDQYEQNIGIDPQPGPHGEVAFRLKWRWPDTTNGDVKAYPAILSGRKPGSYSSNYLPAGQAVRLRDGNISLTSPSGATPGTFFPLQLPVSSLTAKASWSHVTPPTGAGHLSYDLWLQSHPGQDEGFTHSSITHEIMIPLDNWGGYGAHPRACWWWSHDVTISGRLFHVYAARDYAPCVDGKNNDTPLLPNFGSLDGAYGPTGWKFIVFQPDVMPMAPGEIDLAAIVNHVGSYADARGNRWATGNEYLVSAELGVEPIQGTGDIIVHDYKVSQNPSPPPTFPSPPTPTTRVQAETGTLSGSGVSVRSDMAGYEGSAFVGGFTATGDKVAVNFPDMTAGTYDVNIRYHAGSSQHNTVQVNGGQLRDVSFPATGDGWAVKTLKWVTLADGANAVNILKDWGYMDVDYVETVPVDPPQTPPPPTRIQAEDGTLTGVTSQTDLPGYEGSGYVGAFENAGDNVAVTFPDVAAGKYDIRIRHRGGYQQNYVDINGTRRSEGFPDTGGDWAIKTISGITLPGGANTIAVSKEWGWTYVDYVEIVPSTAPSTDTPTRKQAENGTLTGVISQTDVPGYEGNSFVGPFANAGDQVAVSFSGVTAGNYDVCIRYNSAANQENTVTINGAPRTEVFTPTDNSWGIKTISAVPLTSGNNTVAIVKDWGWINVDSIEIVPSG